MLGHVRASLALLVLTLVLSSVIYPMAVWGIGQAVFPDRAQGSLMSGPDGKPVGSRLIAQPFTQDEYFQPRPSAASYNAAASGASNWGASNALLRDRVARALGTLARYRDGRPVGPDVEKWFQRQPPDLVARWAIAYPSLAEQWVKDHRDAVASYLKKDGAEIKDNSADAAKDFFASYTMAQPGTWPGVSEEKAADGQTTKRIQPLREGSDVQSYLFDLWRQANPDADLEEVPADLLTASGSGLDPHITLKGALYQLPRVAAAWAKKTGRGEAALRQELESLLREKSEAPLGGLFGVKLVNVLEVNLALREHYGSAARASR